MAFACFFCLSHCELFSETINYGPIRGDLGFQSGFEYTDNFNNSTKKVSNLYLNVGPTFMGGLNFPVRIGTTAGGDELTFNTGVSYSEKISLTTNRIEQTFSSPITADLTVPFRFEDWNGRVAESFSFDNTSLENAVLASQHKVDTYNNIASISVDRNMGKAGISFGVERMDKMTPSTPTQNETDYLFSLTPSFHFRENYQFFWTTAYGLVFPVDLLRQEVQSITTSVGISGQITPAFNGSIQVGYGLSHLVKKITGPGQSIFGGIFDPNVLPAENLGGISSSMAGSYSHPLYPNTVYSVSISHSPGVTALLSSSSIQAVTTISLSLAHQLTKTFTLIPSVQFENIQALGVSSTHEKENLLVIEMNLVRQFSDRLSMTIKYSYAYRISNLPNSTYDTTLITVDGTYRF